MLSEDVPVKYVKGEQLVTGFADPKSFQLKNSSKLLPLNSVLNPMYKIEDQWYCNTGRIVLCDKPEQFQIDTTAMKEAISAIAESTRYTGGMSDEQSRMDFQRIIALQNEVGSVINNIGVGIITGNIESVQKTLHLEDVKTNVMSQVYGNMLKHPMSMQVLVFLVIVGVSILCYLFWTLRRIAQVRRERHQKSDSKEGKLSKMNYVWAFLSHSKMDINLNKKKILEARAEVDNLRTSLAQLNAKLDILNSVTEPQALVPPAYHETIETV